MKKFVFSLEKVLSFQRQKLDVKKQELSVLHGSLHELEQEIRNLEARFAGLNGEMRQAAQTGMNACDMAAYKTYFRTLDEKIKKLTESKAELLRRIEDKKASIIQSNTEISGLEKLRDKQLDAYLKEGRKKQQFEIEEFVARQAVPV